VDFARGINGQVILTDEASATSVINTNEGKEKTIERTNGITVQFKGAGFAKLHFIQVVTAEVELLTNEKDFGVGGIVYEKSDIEGTFTKTRTPLQYGKPAIDTPNLRAGMPNPDRWEQHPFITGRMLNPTEKLRMSRGYWQDNPVQRTRTMFDAPNVAPDIAKQEYLRYKNAHPLDPFSIVVNLIFNTYIVHEDGTPLYVVTWAQYAGESTWSAKIDNISHQPIIVGGRPLSTAEQVEDKGFLSDLINNDPRFPRRNLPTQP
jgi:hypothetical protein